MTENSCPSCSLAVAGEFRFCPHCGYDLHQPIVCPDCQYANESNSKFCQECGLGLRTGQSSKTRSKRSASPAQGTVMEIEPPPSSGITIEFPFSTAQSFDFAVESARKFPTFREYGKDKKAVYRVTFASSQIDSSLDLVEHLKGWRRRTVYVDGEKVTWDSVFSFTWCHERKKVSYKPELYCFGYESEYEYNIWGCIQARLPFAENANWFCWGRWLNENGDWQFDKERIRHELEKNLYAYRFCPALQPGLVEDVLQALPDIVNPIKDSNWKFVERWGDESAPSLLVVVDRYGFKEQVLMKGVCPNGRNVLKDMAKKLKFRLPLWD
jgi:double zinc ribbon protein